MPLDVVLGMNDASKRMANVQVRLRKYLRFISHEKRATLGQKGKNRASKVRISAFMDFYC